MYFNSKYFSFFRILHFSKILTNAFLIGLGLGLRLRLELRLGLRLGREVKGH